MMTMLKLRRSATAFALAVSIGAVFAIPAGAQAQADLGWCRSRRLA